MKHSSIENIILLTIDSLRYDRLGYVTGNMYTSPTTDYLAKHGVSCDNAFTHACPTQMAMPSLFTSSLPLDHCGYDTIRHRPCTIAETLKAQGFRTIGLNSGTAMSSFYGYDRGFDEYYEFFSLDCFFFAYRKLYCEYYYELFVKEIISRHEFVTIMSERITKIFDYIERYCRQMLEYIKDDFIVLDNVLTTFPYEKILKNVQLSREAIKVSPDIYIMSKVEFFQVSPRTYSKDEHQRISMSFY